MSEIFAPGSIAGPQGPAGPAGSAAAVSALAAAITPTFIGRNLFDVSQILSGMQVNAADGALSANVSTNATPLLYCPGATSATTNLPVGVSFGNAAVCLYDANGDFLSALPPAAFANPNGSTAIAGTPWTLPGTQTYIRFCYVPSWLSWTGYPGTDTAGMVYATRTGTASLPASYSPAGLATVADVNAKLASAAASTNAAISAASTAVGVSMGLFAQTVLPVPCGPARNAFDPQKVIANTILSMTGAHTPSPGWSTAVAFAPGATQFITNLPIRGAISNVGICLLDATGNVLEEISATMPSSYFSSGALLQPNMVLPLPGTQTFVTFSYNPGNFGWGPSEDGFKWATSDASALFMVGNAANPCPASLPAGAPSFGLQGTHVKTASSLGCPLDSNVVTGGGTDVTSLLNAFLATASVTNPITLILDGPCLTTGLIVAPAGYTAIDGVGHGSGLYVADGANRNAITIGAGAPYDDTVGGSYNLAPPPRTTVNVAVRNMTINQNGAKNTRGMGILVANCSGFLMENVNYLQAYAFASAFTNSNLITVKSCRFTSTGTLHDGVHLNGKCEDITISDCYFATGDDAIALNAPEGYGGDISRVTVTNCIFDSALTVMRIYTSLDLAAMPSNNVHRVRNVAVTNCVGSVTSTCFNLGITNGGLSSTADADQIQDLSVSNCTFSAPQGLAMLLAPMGSVSFHQVRLIPTGTQAVIQVWAGYSFGEILLDGFSILRNADGNAAPEAVVQMFSGATVDRLRLRSCRVIDQEGSSYAALPSLVDNAGAISALDLDAVDMTHVAALFSTAGSTGVSLLRGAGVLGTGTQLPDSIMDSNALYLSSNAAGAPSIKVGGVARRLALA